MSQDDENKRSSPRPPPPSPMPMVCANPKGSRYQDLPLPMPPANPKDSRYQAPPLAPPPIDDRTWTLADPDQPTTPRGDASPLLQPREVGYREPGFAPPYDPRPLFPVIHANPKGTRYQDQDLPIVRRSLRTTVAIVVGILVAVLVLLGLVFVAIHLWRHG